MSTDLQPTAEISRFGLAILRRWRTVVVCVVTLLVAAAAWLVLGPSSVTATAEVSVNVISTDPFSPQRTSSELIDPATEQQLIRSSDVLDRAAAELGDGMTAASILRGLDTEVIPASTVVRISWTGSDASRAQDVADTLAQEYLAYRSELARERQQDTLAPLTQRRDTLIEQLRKARTGRTALLNELNLVYSQITQVSSLATSGGTVLTRTLGSLAAVSDTGTLVVQTKPKGLRVFVDGVEHGLTPVRLPVRAGDHLLEVRGNKSVDIPGAVTVIAALVGAALLGVVGALLAIPTAAAILMLVREVFVRRQDAA